MADDLSDAIRDSAFQPRRASGDSGSVEQHPLKDQIAADKHLASRQAAGKGLGIRRVKLSPPGAS